MIGALAAGAMLAVMVAVEAATPRPPRPGAVDRDAGSFWVFSGAIYVGVAGGALVAWLRDGSPSFTALAAAAGLVLAGSLLRVWSIATLGAHFTRQVQVSSDQPIVEVGPYRWIRHPSYSALLVDLGGVAVATGDPFAGAIVLAAPAVAIAWRVRVEERALHEVVGAPYSSYAARTKRFVPWVV